METFKVITEGQAGTVVLSAIMDMATSSDFLTAVQKCVADHQDVRFAADKVERLSTPCIQVIASCALAVEKKGGTFKILTPSEGFKRGMKELGFENHLENWSIN